MEYSILVSAEAKSNLKEYLSYLVHQKKSRQAAKNVLDDYKDTIDTLKNVAGSLKLCDNPKLAKRGLRRINFKRHNYFMLYYLDNSNVVITNIFHKLEDYEAGLN